MSSGSTCSSEHDKKNYYQVVYHPSTSYEIDLVKNAISRLQVHVNDDGDNDNGTRHVTILTWAKSADINWPLVLANSAQATAYYLRTSVTRKAELARLADRNTQAADKLKNILPTTHVLDGEDDEGCFDRARQTGGVWILKPSEGNRGRGLVVADASDTSSWRRAVAAREAQPDATFVLQRYVAKPLLLSRRKFHVRVHVLCVGDVRVLVHEHAVVLLSATAYDATDLDNRAAHVTNHCVQAAQEDGDGDRDIELGLPEACEALWDDHEHLRATFSNATGMYKWLQASLADSAETVFGAALGGPPLGFFPIAGSCELFGLDVLLSAPDEPGNVGEPAIGINVLEVNADPSMAVFGNRPDMRARCAEMLLDVARLALAEAARHTGEDDATSTFVAAEQSLPACGFREVLSHQRPVAARAARLRALRRLMTGLNSVRDEAHEAGDSDDDNDNRIDNGIDNSSKRSENRALVDIQAPGGSEMASALRDTGWRVRSASAGALREREVAVDKTAQQLLFGVARADVDWARVLADSDPMLVGVLFRGDVLFSPSSLKLEGDAIPAFKAIELLVEESKDMPRPGLWQMLRPATDASPAWMDDPRAFDEVRKRLVALSSDDDASTSRTRKRMLEILEVLPADNDGCEDSRALVLVAGRPARCYCYQRVMKADGSWNEHDLVEVKALANVCARAVTHAASKERSGKARILLMSSTFELMYMIFRRGLLVRFEPLSALPASMLPAGAVTSSLAGILNNGLDSGWIKCDDDVVCDCDDKNAL